MQQYHDLLSELLDRGRPKGDRTGTGTLSKFGHQMRFDLSEGFPLITTKRVPWKAIVYELLWFLRGDTNIKYLQDHGVTIWDEWADAHGDLGPVYGRQWRSWPAARVIHTGEPHLAHVHYIDQIANVIERIKTNPDCRRLIVSAWNPGELDQMALAPCHTMFQFYVQENKLSCQLYQRSADVFLGLPFNIASYALLTHMIANICDLYVGDFVWTGGDVHLYRNHEAQALEQLTRDQRPLPDIYLNPQIRKIDDYQFSDIDLVRYNPHPSIKAPVAV